MEESKTCRVCGESKPLSQYYLRGNGRHRNDCKVCNNARNHAWRKSNKGRLANYESNRSHKQREYKLKREFNISLPDYLALVDMHGNRCAICNGKEKGSKQLSVDHCHKTGNVRGLLCSSCNLTLGKMRDSTKRLRDAAKYLEHNADGCMHRLPPRDHNVVCKFCENLDGCGIKRFDEIDKAICQNFNPIF